MRCTGRSVFRPKHAGCFAHCVPPPAASAGWQSDRGERHRARKPQIGTRSTSPARPPPCHAICAPRTSHGTFSGNGICLYCWERFQLPEPHHELTFDVIKPTPHSPLLVRYQPAEGTASGGIGCDVRRHDRDRAATCSRRFVFVLCCLAGARSCCGTDDDGASPPPPPSLLRRLLSLDLLCHLSVRARDAARRHALGGDDRDLDRDQGRERHLPEPEPVVPVPADGARDHGHGHGRGRHRPAPTSLRVAHVGVMSRVALRRHVSPAVGRRRHDRDDDDQRSAVGGRRSAVGGRRSTAGGWRSTAAAAVAQGMTAGRWRPRLMVCS